MALALTVLLLALPAPQATPLLPERLVTISVAEDRIYTLAHEIVIQADPPVAARTTAELEGRTWRAIRTSARGVETITSDDCPALRAVALSFADLPAVPVSPMASRVFGPHDLLPPTRKDGYATRLSFATRTADGSWAQIQIDGGNAYAEWGHAAVSALVACWSPLTP